MIVKKSSNEESAELPSYLSSGKHYKKSPRNCQPYPSRKCFPRHKYGVATDAPSEFQTSNSILSAFTNKSVLYNDLSVKHEKPRKILTKELMNEWPLQNIQTSDITNSTVPHKFETKSVNSRELYNCILHNSKVVQRPDIITGEETLYTAKYYDSLKENKTFHKKTGYFQEFAKQHKITKEEYKIRQVDADDHNRYASKPVIFTTTKTKNTMSKHTSHDHTKLLQSIKERRSISPSKHEKHINLSQFEESEIPKPTENTNIRFKNFMEDSEPVEKDPKVFQTHKSFYASYLKKLPGDNGQKVSLINKGRTPELAEGKRYSSVQPMRHSQSMAENENQEYKSRRSPHSSILSIEKGNSNHSQQEMLRYSTKKVTDTISHNREQAIKEGEPEAFIKHTVENDNRRSSDIEVSVLQKNRKLAKQGDGNAVRYSSVPHKRPQEIFNVNDNIKKFERHIDGLRTTSANFGHQRWFYDKNWKLGAVKNRDIEILNKSAINC